MVVGLIKVQIINKEEFRSHVNDIPPVALNDLLIFLKDSNNKMNVKFDNIDDKFDNINYCNVKIHDEFHKLRDNFNTNKLEQNDKIDKINENFDKNNIEIKEEIKN